jgi:hypothetical protein
MPDVDMPPINAAVSIMPKGHVRWAAKGLAYVISAIGELHVTFCLQNAD